MSGPASLPGRWGDLPKRLVSAAFMLGIGGVEIWWGGKPFAVLVVGLTGLMIWELVRMTGTATPASARLLGVLAALVLFGVLAVPSAWGPLPLLIVPLVAGALSTRDRALCMAYALAVMLTGHTLVGLREQGGTPVILWLLAVVVASDVMGYFAGRLLGGPKFWPAISPKKTWSGTVAGWIGAALVAVAFVTTGRGGWGLVLLSPLVAFAGQMGDIAESWIKRRAGVKDSSSLIPGHGGVLDRFDAVIGAVLAVLLLGLALPLPLPHVGG